MADIIDLLEDYRDGDLLKLINEHYTDLIGACEDHELGGTLSIKVKLSPKGDGLYTVAASVDSNKPTRSIKPAMFFTDADGNLTRRNMRQTDIEDFTGDEKVSPLRDRSK